MSIDGNDTYNPNTPGRGLLIIRSSSTQGGIGIIALAGSAGQVLYGGSQYNIDDSGALVKINLGSVSPYNFTITNKVNSKCTIYYVLLQV